MVIVQLNGEGLDGGAAQDSHAEGQSYGGTFSAVGDRRKKACSQKDFQRPLVDQSIFQLRIQELIALTSDITQVTEEIFGGTTVVRRSTLRMIQYCRSTTLDKYILIFF